MICPKCGFKQSDGEECIKCGIIIKKFSDEQRAARAVGKAFQENDQDGKIQEVTVLTDDYSIQGQIRLAPAGYRSRLSDFLNEEGVDFIPLLNVKITSILGELDIPFAEVVLINKTKINLIIPE